MFYDSAQAPKQGQRKKNGNGIFAHCFHLLPVCIRRTSAQKWAAADSFFKVPSGALPP